MTKLPVNPVKIRVKLYNLIEEAVLRGINGGYARTIKHMENEPDNAFEISLKDHIEQYVMMELNEIIDFDEHYPEEIQEITEPPVKIPFDRKLLEKAHFDHSLSVRSANCLKNENIVYIGDLVQKSESYMLRANGLGRKSFNEIKEALYEMGLGFGMTIKGWPPENIEDLIKKLKREEENDE